jgi:hypothetical protein
MITTLFVACNRVGVLAPRQTRLRFHCTGLGHDLSWPAPVFRDALAKRKGREVGFNASRP